MLSDLNIGPANPLRQQHFVLLSEFVLVWTVWLRNSFTACKSTESLSKNFCLYRTMPIEKINSAVEALEKIKVFKTYKKRDHIHQQLANGRLNPINCIFSITITY